MRHLAFYYAIGFAIVGCIMLATGLSTLFGIMLGNHGAYGTAALGATMLLPFAIATLSWREWKQAKNGQDLVQQNLGSRERPIWAGRPWILPDVLVRSLLVFAVAFAVVWLEFYFGIAYANLLNIQVVMWTCLGLSMAWLLSLSRLFSLRISNNYVLRADCLEVRVGVLTSKSYVVAPSGFSDLEVVRSVGAKITNSGNIFIRTQSENDMLMRKVRNPLEVANRIRKVLARPVFRIQEQESVLQREKT